MVSYARERQGTGTTEDSGEALVAVRALSRLLLVSASSMIFPVDIDNMRIFKYGRVVKPGKRVTKARTSQTTPGGAGTPRSPRQSGPDPLAEARPAVNTILASWALRALLARRASEA
jgi:hypothetical protein